MFLKLVKIILFMFVCVFTLLVIPVNSVFASGQEMPVLRLGDTNDAVYTLQRELEKRGFYQSDVDGKFGSDTKLAVVEFQQVAGIEDDGIVGLETWQAIRNFVGNTESSRGNFNRKIGQQIANFAQGFLGVPYAWGGQLPEDLIVLDLFIMCIVAMAFLCQELLMSNMILGKGWL